MYYKMSEKEQKLLKEVQKITFTEYETEEDKIEIKKLWDIIADLKLEYEEKGE